MNTRSACDPGRPASRTGSHSCSPGRLLVLIWLALAFPTLAARAACPDGTILVDIPTALSTPKTASDGAGGSYVVWLNVLSPISFQLFALRVDASGRVVSGWPSGGLQVTSKTAVSGGISFSEDYNICVDSNGRLVVVWLSNVADVPKVFAQRINSAGTLEWGDGMSVFSTTYREIRPVISADEIGGCFIAAQMEASTWDVYVQGIDSSGAKWAGDRVACGAAFDQVQPSIAYVGSGYAVIAWTDYRYSIPGNVDTDIYGQRVSTYGDLVWGATGKPVCSYYGNQSNPIVGRGKTPGEAYVIWSDERRAYFNNAPSGTVDMYIQRFYGYGDPVWGLPGNKYLGIEVNATDGLRQVPIAVLPAPDGVTFTWSADNAGASQHYIFGQHRLDADGSVPNNWGAFGTVIAGPNGIKSSYSAVGNGDGGFAMSWMDQRTASPGPGVYATRFTANGVPATGWTSQGTAMGLSGDPQTETGVALLSGGGLFVVWSRAGDIYEQATSSSAAIVTVPPRPINVAATECTGSGVTVTWSDVCGETEYRVYRSGTQIATLSADATTYFDPNDQPTSPPAGTYEYCVQSYRASGGLSDAGCDMGCMPPRLQIVAPNGGESWPPGSQQTIRWNGPSDPVTIQLFVDGAPSGGSMQGVSTTLATNATGGSYSFIVPDVATTRARVQISQMANGVTKYVYSANPFTMATSPPANTWSYYPVDDLNHGWNQSDLCANGSGGVYAAYLDYLSGQDLRFASQAGKTSPWGPPTVAKSAGSVGSWPSIVCGSNGTVHIAYYDFTLGSAKLYYTSGNPANSSPSSWPQELVSDIGVVQGDCSIALDDHSAPYIAFNTGNAGNQKLRVFKRQNNGSWANFGNWYNEDITWPHHITLRYAGNNMFWVACTDQQTASRLNLWKYNAYQWVKLDAPNFLPGPYTDVSLALDPLGNPYLAYTVPSNGGQNLIFHPWALEGMGLGTPVTLDPTLGTISSVSLQYGPSYPRIGYVGNGVVKQATGIYSATVWPCDWTREVVDATGNMDSQVSLVVQPNDERWYLYRNLTTQTMWSAAPYYSGGGGGGGHPKKEFVKPFSIADEASRPPRVVVIGGLGSAPLRFRFEGARKDQPVRVDIFDVRGRLVQTLRGRDTDELTWNRHDRTGAGVASGIILYRAVAGLHAFTGKTVLTQ